MNIRSTSPITAWRRSFEGRLVLAFVVVRAMFGVFTGRLAVLPDTPMYLPAGTGIDLSKVSLMGHGPRPWTVVLPYAINNLNLLSAVQVFVGIVSWVALILVAARGNHASRQAAVALPVLVALIGLSGSVTVWDGLAQADSIAMSGAVLCLAGTLRTVQIGRFTPWSVAAMFFGVIGGGLIRPGVVLIASAGIVFSLAIFAAGRRHSLRQYAAVLVLFGTFVYVIKVNDNMDRSWGRDFVGNEEVRGRTLQQVAIIGAYPNGGEYVTSIAREDFPESSCIHGVLATPIPGGDAKAWWNNGYASCPEAMSRFSKTFVRNYLTRVATHPLRSLYVFWPAVAESYRISGPVCAVCGVVPRTALQIIYGDAEFGVFLPLVTLLAVVALMMTGQRGRRRVIAGAVGPFIAVMVGSLGGTAFTVLMSPLDTTRVAAPFMVTATISCWFALVAALDRRFGREGL